MKLADLQKIMNMKQKHKKTCVVLHPKIYELFESALGELPKYVIKDVKVKE